MAILKNIEWIDTSTNTIIKKYEFNKNQVNKGSALTVREGQVCIFVNKGQLADVFLPGFYKLDTDNMPVLTKLMSWKYGFQTPFKCDIYFVNTKLFTDQKWGTANPILIRDKDYGAIRVRGFGSYAFSVEDAFVFMKSITGTSTHYTTDYITKHLKDLIISAISDTIAESNLGILDITANLSELSDKIELHLVEDFKSVGLKLNKFNFVSITLPEELEKALDKNASLTMMRKNMDVYTQMETLDAMKTAAGNSGTLGGVMGAGMGMSMGVGMGQMLNQNINNAQNSFVCPKCNATIQAGSKFCPECGENLNPTCSKCGKQVPINTKFCPECGTKI